MTPEKWFAYPRYQQILSIANELNRAQNALIRGDHDNAVHAWERAFELTDLTIEAHLSETLLIDLLRFRENLGEIFTTQDAIAHKQLITTLIGLDEIAGELIDNG